MINSLFNMVRNLSWLALSPFYCPIKFAEIAAIVQ